MNQVSAFANLDNVPYFDTSTFEKFLGKTGDTLRTTIKRLLQNGDFIRLKRGFYVTKKYFELANKALYSEFIANKLKEPSYLSTEYVLQKYSILTESVFVYTSITIKKPNSYFNNIGNFVYQSVSSDLFCGYRAKSIGGYDIYEATKAKALFDYLYLKFYRFEAVDVDLLVSLRLNLDELTDDDFLEFNKYAVITGIKKYIELSSKLRGIKDDI